MAVEVKICGITTPADAAVAAEAGATYLGVVLSSGPRRIDERTAADIVAAAGEVPVLGVFGGGRGADIAALCRRMGLSGAQLHGPHTEADAVAVRDTGLLVWRAIRLPSGELPVDIEARARSADAVLLEPRVDGVDGGAGVALDTTLAIAARARLPGARVALAGGLTPESVVAAIRAILPDIVDVSSGVESSPGRKSPERVIRFLEAVRGCDS